MLLESKMSKCQTYFTTNGTWKILELQVLRTQRVGSSVDKEMAATSISDPWGPPCQCGVCVDLRTNTFRIWVDGG